MNKNELTDLLNLPPTEFDEIVLALTAEELNQLLEIAQCQLAELKALENN